MKLYKTRKGPVLEAGQGFRLLSGESDWDSLVNRDDLRLRLEELAALEDPSDEAATAACEELLAPIGSQEVWAAGVTYFSSRLARMEESRDAGGGDFYSRVYEADRPELFMKATPARVVHPGEPFRIRSDSQWDVPEPELTLFVTSSGEIVAYSVGNDVSSRSIEGENPLYLPQAKTYDDCACIGPCLYVPEAPLPPETKISLEICRQEQIVFTEAVLLRQMKRTPEELVDFLFRETSFTDGVFLMTGTGIVPGTDFTLLSGDQVSISIDGIGTLTNSVA
ncbi:MAG: 2-hydroxyhepta-2,4-diene-1,7-dioate isomerase [Opitutae bacterium]|nr:2-hydroxyhepta-2,4-diene-1,7-dioate isomerase [Opitutae bacterium]|tara:strand:+ start:370 stop:1209 length:840 start_codon:yes stop_codon:yes gene_type:complete